MQIIPRKEVDACSRDIWLEYSTPETQTEWPAPYICRSPHSGSGGTRCNESRRLADICGWERNTACISTDWRELEADRTVLCHKYLEMEPWEFVKADKGLDIGSIGGSRII